MLKQWNKTNSDTPPVLTNKHTILPHNDFVRVHLKLYNIHIYLNHQNSTFGN